MNEVYVIASRGRDTKDTQGVWIQKLEINKTGYTNTITSVAKDNLVLVVVK